VSHLWFKLFLKIGWDRNWHCDFMMRIPHVSCVMNRFLLSSLFWGIFSAGGKGENVDDNYSVEFCLYYVWVNALLFKMGII